MESVALANVRWSAAVNLLVSVAGDVAEAKSGHDCVS